MHDSTQERTHDSTQECTHDSTQARTYAHAPDAREKQQPQESGQGPWGTTAILEPHLG